MLYRLILQDMGELKGDIVPKENKNYHKKNKKANRKGGLLHTSLHTYIHVYALYNVLYCDGVVILGKKGQAAPTPAPVAAVSDDGITEGSEGDGEGVTIDADIAELVVLEVGKDVTIKRQKSKELMENAKLHPYANQTDGEQIVPVARYCTISYILLYIGCGCVVVTLYSDVFVVMCL